MWMDGSDELPSSVLLQKISRKGGEEQGCTCLREKHH